MSASPRARAGGGDDRKIREAFALIDTDGSGTIDFAELTVRMRPAASPPARASFPDIALRRGCCCLLLSRCRCAAATALPPLLLAAFLLLLLLPLLCFSPRCRCRCCR